LVGTDSELEIIHLVFPQGNIIKIIFIFVGVSSNLGDTDASFFFSDIEEKQVGVSILSEERIFTLPPGLLILTGVVVINIGISVSILGRFCRIRSFLSNLHN